MITEEQWDVIEENILAIPGMRTDADSDFIAEDGLDDDGQDVATTA